MNYISIPIVQINNRCKGYDHIISITLNKSLHSIFTYNGDWFIHDSNRHYILTEKCNALIHLLHTSTYNDSSYKNLTGKYNITKFLLLKEILLNCSLTDLLQNIVDISE